MVSRRDVLMGAGSLAAGTLIAPGIAFARAATDRRFVVVILRGGLDGLDLAPPYGDPNYQRLRPSIAHKPPGQAGGVHKLDGRFGLHPALGPLHEMYQARQLLVVQAVGTPYRKRSHFDGQNILENGTETAYSVSDGWLNRALAAMPGGSRAGLAVGNGVPLLMRGKTRVRTWAPKVLPVAADGFLDLVSGLYRHDPLFRRALAEGRRSVAMTGKAMDGRTTRRRGAKRFSMRAVANATGRLLAAPDGPRVASLEIGGWDTHANQRGTLNRRLKDLGGGFAELKTALGPAWNKTVILVLTEFGRTARENGTRGTDHGTGGAALVLGGAVRGGRIVGRWPGLRSGDLYEGRDLHPTTDYRAVAKGLLREHLGLSNSALDQQIFPASGHIRPVAGLVRSV